MSTTTNIKKESRIGSCHLVMRRVLVLLFMVIALIWPSQSQAGPTNGGFETGDLTGWTTQTYSNLGISYSLPMTKAKLNLQGTSASIIGVATTSTHITPFPQVGSYAAVVNLNGASNMGGALTQTYTVGEADRRPDGNIHVVTAYAFVLNNAGHTANQQPYFYIEITNVTKATVLYSKFAYAGEQGVAATLSGDSYYYSNWQIADIAPGDSGITSGDQIKIEAIAAGCSQGGHAGWVYLDTTGSVYPGLSVAATGSTVVATGADITYTFNYSNGGGAGATNASVTFVTPPNTTYKSHSGATCTAPSVGTAGTITCALGAVAPAGYGSFNVVTNVTNGSSGTITNGNYYIQADSVVPLYGAAFTTSILTNYPVTASPGANGTLSCSPTTVNMGSTASCTANANGGYYLTGITGCGINYTNSNSSVTSQTVNSTAYNASCTVASTYALGPISVAASAGAGGTVDSAYRTTPQLIPYNGTVSFKFDANPGYYITGVSGCGGTAYTNSGPDYNMTTQTFTTGPITSTCTVSASYALGYRYITTSVPTANGTLSCVSPVINGTDSLCTMSPATGYHLSTLTVAGSNVYTNPGNNTTLATYNITAVGSDKAIVANFAINTYSVSASPGINGTVTGGASGATVTRTTNYGVTQTFTYNADTGYHITSISGCSGTAYNPVYTTGTSGITTYNFLAGAATSDCTVSASFATNQYTVTASAGSGGTLSASTTSPQVKNYNTTHTYTFNADTGYHITSISGCSGTSYNPVYTTGTSGITTYNFLTGAATSDCTVSASFATNQYTVTASAGSGGTLSASTTSPQMKNYGATHIFTFNANTGSHVTGVTGCGAVAYSPAYTVGTSGVSSYSYTTGSASTDCTVNATFSTNQYNVSAVPGTNGTITGGASGASVARTTNYGVTQTFTFNANTGYHLTQIGNGCGGSVQNFTYTNGGLGTVSASYTSSGATVDCTTTATTVINQFDVTATPDAHSKISGYALNTPHTYSSINYNGSQAVSFLADTGYHLTGITNSCSGSVSATYSNVVNGPWTASADFTPSGTITNGVAPNCSITATSAINVYSITPTVGIVGP